MEFDAEPSMKPVITSIAKAMAKLCSELMETGVTVRGISFSPEDLSPEEEMDSTNIFLNVTLLGDEELENPEDETPV